MPAFNYKERFVPLIKDRSKRQTIRAFRNYLVKKGQELSHFYGMRTKHCTRIIPNTPCHDVATIFILPNGDLWLCFEEMEKPDAEWALSFLIRTRKKPLVSPVQFKQFTLFKLSDAGKNHLAWADGFRVDGSTEKSNEGCFDLMFRWWNQTHALPFTGQMIKWK